MMERHRPAETKADDSRFFLGINHGKGDHDVIWFKRAPMGEKTLGNLMSKAANQAGLQGRFVNHSGRKTAVNFWTAAPLHNMSPS